MNAKIRIAICLILSLCLLLLPACKGGQTQNPSGPSEQKVDQTDATDHLSQTQMTEATQQTENNTEATKAAETLYLNWKAKVIKGNVFFHQDLETLYADSLYGTIAMKNIHLDYEGYEKLKADFAAMLATKTHPPKNPLAEAPYSKEFFEKNSLILMNVGFGYSTHFEIKNLSYTDGVVVCEIDIYYILRSEPYSVPAANTDYLFFLEVDADLPEITNITIKYNDVPLSQEEFDQKIKELEERFGS